MAFTLKVDMDEDTIEELANEVEYMAKRIREGHLIGRCWELSGEETVPDTSMEPTYEDDDPDEE